MKRIIKTFKALLKDKRGEELCTGMYNPLERAVVRFKVRRNLKRLGYAIERSLKEDKIFDKDFNLIAKLKTVFYNRMNIEPTIFIDRKYDSEKLKNAIQKSGCSFGYLE